MVGCGFFAVTVKKRSWRLEIIDEALHHVGITSSLAGDSFKCFYSTVFINWMRLKSNILLMKYLSLCFQFCQSGVFIMSWLECMFVALFFLFCYIYIYIYIYINNSSHSIFPSLFCQFFLLPALFHMLLYKDCKTKKYFYILIRKVGKSSLLKPGYYFFFKFCSHCFKWL